MYEFFSHLAYSLFSFVWFVLIHHAADFFEKPWTVMVVMIDRFQCSCYVISNGDIGLHPNLMTLSNANYFLVLHNYQSEERLFK